MKLYFITTKRGLYAFVLSLLIALFVIAEIRSGARGGVDGSTHLKRIEYLNALEIWVEEDSFRKETVIPAEFDEIYKKYNAIQKKAGFDLSLYKGKAVTLYTYDYGNSRRVNLLVHKGEVVGGDICDIKAQSKVYPLTKQ